MDQTAYGFTKKVDLPFDKAIEKVTDDLKNEGFGVLTEIDVKATMKKKLDVDVRPYHILGACNPPFAYKALQAEEQIGLLLPCNVIVYIDNEDRTVVAAIDPLSAMSMVENENLQPVAVEVQEKLKKVIENV